MKNEDNLILIDPVQYIKYDLYKDGILVFKKIDNIQLLHTRSQIAERKLKGYSLKINKNYLFLIDETLENEEVLNYEVKISDNGEIENKWFPFERTLSGYEFCEIGGEALIACIQLRNIMKM
jgi:hypothetical protein